MEPFIIIKNYRQSRQLEEITPPPRPFLREIDPSTLPFRQPSTKALAKAYSEDDKEVVAEIVQDEIRGCELGMSLLEKKSFTRLQLIFVKNTSFIKSIPD